jgi:broad specificity phosphatase PhoE
LTPLAKSAWQLNGIEALEIVWFADRRLARCHQHEAHQFRDKMPEICNRRVAHDLMAAQIYLIRHGETTWSLSGQHTGRTDLPLTEHGALQARHIGKLLSGTTFSQVLVSPLQRARRTCDLAGFGAAARVEQNLSEWNYGDYEGRTPADIRAQRPSWDIYRDGAPGGESADQVSARADLVIAELRAMIGRIAIFSHGQFLRALAVRWIDLPIQRGCHFELGTGSLSILGYEHNNVEAPAILLWNAVPNDACDLVPRQHSDTALLGG